MWHWQCNITLLCVLTYCMHVRMCNQRQFRWAEFTYNDCVTVIARCSDKGRWQDCRTCRFFSVYKQNESEQNRTKSWHSRRHCTRRERDLRCCVVTTDGHGLKFRRNSPSTGAPNRGGVYQKFAIFNQYFRNTDTDTEYPWLAGNKHVAYIDRCVAVPMTLQ